MSDGHQTLRTCSTREYYRLRALQHHPTSFSLKNEVGYFGGRVSIFVRGLDFGKVPIGNIMVLRLTKIEVPPYPNRAPPLIKIEYPTDFFREKLVGWCCSARSR